MSLASEPRFSTHGQLLKRSWGGETVLFHPDSGDTHLLDLVAAELLDVLTETPETVEVIKAKLAARLEVEPDDPLGNYVAQTLRRFASSGLVEVAGA